MSDIQLSKDADYLICLIYKHYLELRDNGISKSDAKILGNSQEVNQNIIPEWSLEDTDDTCRELIKNDLLDNRIYMDNYCGYMNLSDNGIVYMENRFKNGFKEVTDFIAKFIPLAITLDIFSINSSKVLHILTAFFREYSRPSETSGRFAISPILIVLKLYIICFSKTDKSFTACPNFI